MTFPSRWRTATLLLLSLLATAAVYWPGLRGSYLFDDYPNIVDNRALHITRLSLAQFTAAARSSTEFARPLAMASFALNYLWTGLDPWPMKFTNLLIHMLNGLLLFGVLRTLLRLHGRASGGDGGDAASRHLPLAVTAGWLLLPINLTGVLYVVQRMESLCQLAVLGGLWIYLRGRERMLTTAHGGGFAIACAGLLLGLALGLASKESAVLLPVYAVTAEWALLRWAGRDDRPDRRLLVLFTLILALPAVLGLAWLLPKMAVPAAYATRSFTLTERLITESRVLVDYLRWTVWPDPEALSFYHDDYTISHGLLRPPSTLAAIALLVALLAAAITLRKRRPLVSLGIIWFFAAHLLTATFIPLELVFEHRNYFASIGVLLATFAALFSTGCKFVRTQLVATLAAIWIAAFAAVTGARALVWANPLALATQEADWHPISPRANYAAATQYLAASRYDKTSPAFVLAWHYLDRAAQLPGSSILPLQAMAVAQDRTGQPVDPALWQRIIDHLRSRPITPEDAAALDSLVQCRIRGVCHFAIMPLQRVMLVALAQPRPSARLMGTYANFAWLVLRDATLTERYLRAAIAAEPSTPGYHGDLARLLVLQGRNSEAMEQVRELRKLDTLGRLDADIEEIETAIHRRPEATTP